MLVQPQQKTAWLTRSFGTGVNEIAMKKTILYKLFGLGSVPKKLLAVLELEEIVVADEGMRGRFIAKHISPVRKLVDCRQA